MVQSIRFIAYLFRGVGLDLVLCPEDDLSALWAYHGLKRRGLEDLELVNTEMLAANVHWDHRIESNGATISITLADGRVISEKSIRGVLNRLVSAPSSLLPFVSPDDREYAFIEFTAFFLSWLYALPGPVLNRPSPQGLSGQWRHKSEWAFLAQKSGLPTAIYKQSTYDSDCIADAEYLFGNVSKFPEEVPTKTIIVIDGNITGDRASQDINNGAQRFAEFYGTEILGIEFIKDPFSERWVFSNATPLPDLRKGGEELLDILASIFREEMSN